MWESCEMHATFELENLKMRDQLGDKGVDRKVILKLIRRK
jgi:hypothetical protein